MDLAYRPGDKVWTAELFLASDQHAFGDAWRYELIDGRIVGQAAPSPDHGAILAGLNVALGIRLRGRPGDCRPEVGSGAAPRGHQRNTARIPDATVRCAGLPRVVFEVVSPSELRNWRARNRKRRDLQDVEGVREIIELYQGEASAHIYRLEDTGTWSFDAVDGLDATLNLTSVGIEIPLAEVYEFVDLDAQTEA